MDRSKVCACLSAGISAVAFASPVSAPREMAVRLEGEQVSGAGVLLPDPGLVLTNDAGCVGLGDAAAAWPQALVSNLLNSPVGPDGCVDVLLRTDEDTGVVLFEDSRGVPLWAEAPDFPVSGNWIAPFRRAAPEPSPSDALYAPHRIVDRWRVRVADALRSGRDPGDPPSAPLRDTAPANVASFSFSAFACLADGLSFDLAWPVPTNVWNRAKALDDFSAVDIYHRNRLERGVWRWLVRDAVPEPAAGAHSLFLPQSILPFDEFAPTNAPTAPESVLTNIVLSPFGIVYTNVVSTSTNAVSASPETGFFKAGNLADSDLDGIPDAFETLVLGTSPVLRDTDGDGIPDGSDPNPLDSDADPATGFPADLDGDSLPDVWEFFRFGATNAVDAATNATASGFSAAAALGAGLDPVADPCETAFPDESLSVTFAVPAFSVDSPAPGQVLWERTFPIERHAGWEQFYVSARPDPAADEPCAVEWQLENLVLEWQDDRGASGTANALQSALRLPLSTDSPTALTLRLRASSSPSGPAVSPRPLRLLRWTPAPVFAELPWIATGQGREVAVISAGSPLRIGLDFDSAHCPGAFALDTNSVSPLAVGLPAGASAEIECGGFVVSGLPVGVYEFPVSDRPALRGAPPSGPALLVFAASVSWTDAHGCDAFRFGPGGEIVSAYPLAGSCLAESFNEDATGGFSCAGEPVVEIGAPAGFETLFSSSLEVSDIPPAELGARRAAAGISFDGVPVWSGTADHFCGSCELDVLTRDSCGCETCVSCDDLDGPSVSSFAFRIALGSPRDGQVSGFVFLRADSSVPDLAPASFRILKRRDAAVTDETDASGVRTVVCRDARGRTIVLSPAPSGVAISVRDTASNGLLNGWELTRSSDSVRVSKTSAGGATMLDRLFTLSGGAWTSSDLVSGATETVLVSDFASDPDDPHHVEERTIRDPDGTVLSREIVVRRPVGTGASAVLRQSERVEFPDTEYEKSSFAEWWDDPECPPRHGTLRCVRGDAVPWRWTDYDALGRPTLSFEQCDGSGMPWEFMSDTRWTLETLPGGIDAIVTERDYTPLTGDSADILDYDVPRTVSRYRLLQDSATTLVSRAWTTVVRRSEGGITVVETRTERAGAQDAAPGDPRNAVSVSAVYDPSGPGVPFALRGKPLLETGEDGASTVYRHEFGGWTAAVPPETADDPPAPGVFAPSPSGAFLRSRSMRVSPEAPAGLPLVSAVSETVSDATYGNEVWSATRALLAPSDPPLSDDAALSDPFGWESRAYDEKNRLRAILFPDGTSSTNSYSCCRLLFSVDRDGLRRDRLSSASRTAFHWADLETGLVSLPRVAYNDLYPWIWNYEYEHLSDIRAVERRLDPLGRETFRREFPVRPSGTNSISSLNPAHPATTWCAVATNAYPDGASDRTVAIDPRGIVTESLVRHSQTNTVSTMERRDGAAMLSRTTTVSERGGPGRIVRTESGGVWTQDSAFSEWLPDGRRRRFSVRSSSDGPVVTNRVEETDFLGRVVRVETPLSIVTNAYFGASPHLAGSFDLTAGTSSSPVYDALLETVGSTRPGGVSEVSHALFEVRSNALWRVSRELEIAGPATNVLSRTSELLTGLSLSRTSLVETETASGGLARVGTTFDPAAKIATETTERDGFAPSVRLLKFGRTIQETGPDGVSRWYYFDPYGRVDLVRETGEGGTVFYRESPCRNAFGDVVEETRYRSVSRPSSPLTRWNGFDRRGNKIASTNESGVVSLYGYDALDRLVSVSGPAQWPLLFEYDSSGRRVSLSTTRDGENRDETRWGYDAASGLCTNKTYADGSSIAYTFSPDGLPLRTTLASGRWTENAYDAFRRLSASTTSDGGGHSLSYDAFGRVAAVADAGAAFDMAFLRAADGSVTNETWFPHATNAEAAVSLDRSFDAWGRLSGLSLSSPATPGGHPAFSSATAVEYSTNGLVSVIVHTNAECRVLSAEFEHDCGKVSGVSLGVGAVAVRHSISRDRFRPELVSDIRASLGPATNAFDVALQHDNLGRPVLRTWLRPFDGSVATNAFAYNDRGEVVSAALDASFSDSYAYDEIGNRLSSSDLFGERAYEADEVNAYTSVSNAASGTAEQPVWDADGNLTHDGDWEYQWNARGQLVAAIRRSAGSVVFREDFAYDWKGRLASREVSRTPANGQTGTESHVYFWDDWLLLRERVADSSGTTNDIEFVWGPDLSGSFQGAGGIGGLLAVSLGGSYYFPFYDQIGNVLGYADDTGSVVAAYDYDAFGNILSSSGPMASFFRHRFSTKLLDPDIGLYYYGYRWYSPALGRWISRDPIEEKGGINLYASCVNCPICSFDSLGTINISGFIDTSDGLGFLEGGLLYYLGDGSTIRVPITKLGLPTNVRSYFDPCSFRKGIFPGTDGTFDTFRMTRVSGWKQGGPGRVRWKMEGDLQWEDNHKRCWTFSGSVKVFPDYFNFDPRPKGERGSVKEGITRAVNRTGGGTNFWVFFDGTLEIKGKGSCR